MANRKALLGDENEFVDIWLDFWDQDFFHELLLLNLYLSVKLWNIEEK